MKKIFNIFFMSRIEAEGVPSNTGCDCIKIKLALLILIISITASPSAFAIGCNGKSVVLKNPEQYGVLALRYKFETKKKNGAIVKDRRGRPVYRITQLSAIDASELKQKYIEEAPKSIPSDRCDVHAGHSYDLIAQSDGDARGYFSYRFEDWFCGWTKSKCTKMERQKVGQSPHTVCHDTWISAWGMKTKSVPKCTTYWKDNIIHVPVFYDCKAKTKYKNYQKTVTVNTIFHPTVDKDYEIININGSTSIDDRGGVPDLLLNAVGVLTLNIGSKWILDNYRATKSKIEDSMPPFNKVIPGGGAASQPIKFNLDSAKFINMKVKMKDTVALETASIADRREGEACFLYNKLLEDNK